MKNLTFLLLVCTFLAQQILNAQTLLLEENFDYTNGSLITVASSTWSQSGSISSYAIQVNDGNLAYSNYLSSNIGKKVNLNGGALRQAVSSSFSSISGDGNEIFVSFLLNVTATTDMDINSSNGDYFFNIEGSSSRCYIYVRQGSISSNYQIGIAKASSSSLSFYTTELNVGTTYLIVASYSFISGSSNDICKLWINPSLDGVEPSANISVDSGSDAASTLSIISLSQRSKSGDMDIDGIRVSTSWSQAPLPVQLKSFNGSASENVVCLSWSTAIELNNYGFAIERKTDSGNDIWKEIGFICGHGNSNSPKEYSFIDYDFPAGNVEYRLKQIDFDGKFEYSNSVKIFAALPNSFFVLQNYPNPFNPNTTIKYKLPSESFVTIKIFDFLGREFATLVNQQKPAGIHSAVFDGKDIPSGIYFYSVRCGKNIQSNKMLLIK